MPRVLVALALATSSLLAIGAGAAQAVVVDMSQPGQASVAYNPADHNVGVALVPGSRDAGALVSAGLPAVTTSAPCIDPALAPELSLPATGLCSHGGPVMHANETFALVWDPNPHLNYASSYEEQFLRDVANASGALGSPYAVTSQYTDAGGRAGNSSLYGGGYDDASGYPASNCPISGIHHFFATAAAFTDVPNDVCLTDATLKYELAAMTVQDGLAGRTQSGYTPLLVLLMPPGVVTCLDSAGKLCSANSDSTVSPAQFCSYHSQVDVNGTVFDYVVQPWTAQTGCDEPDSPKFPTGAIDPVTLTNDMGARLVSPLSQAQIAATVNPALNGWFALDGSEINDNGCAPLANQLDQATVGGASYLLQREFNNAGIMVNDPFTIPCAPSVELSPAFVVPSAVSVGDVVEFDGSKTRSGLLVPRANYHWDFGDGTTADGPSVVHSYGTPGTHDVKLTVTDRGGNVSSLTQQIVVLGPNGQPPAGSPSSTPGLALRVRMALIPQGLRAVLARGVAVRVTSNKPADGIASVMISRSAARRAHIRSARAPVVVIGRGTFSGIVDGTVTLHVRLSRGVARKLRRLRHVTLTVRLALMAAGRDHVTIDAAGRY